MSYILDALKKSQRERALGSIPQIDAPPPDTAVRRGGRIAVAAVAAAVLIAGGIAAGMYLSRPASAPLRTAPSQAAPQELSPAVGSAATQPEPQSAPESESESESAAESAAPVAARAPATQPAAPEPAQVAAPLLADTPLAYQRQVPSMSINVVSYSEAPERRFVMIDLVMYREGQTLPNGATVIAIAPDEVTFSFAGARFRLRP
jgi:general secretion pathway protein B